MCKASARAHAEEQAALSREAAEKHRAEMCALAERLAQVQNALDNPEVAERLRKSEREKGELLLRQKLLLEEMEDLR